MSYQASPFLKKLDRMVAFTGVEDRIRHPDRYVAMPFRIASLLFLVWAGIGLFLQTRMPDVGWINLMLAWSSGFPLMFTGPLRVPPGGAYDERERALIRAGHFAGLLTVAVLAIGGCFLAGITSAMSLLHWAAPLWTPVRIQDWIALGFFLLIVELNVAVLYVSWTLPRRMPGDDEG
jgi:hypothetical protein